MINTSLNLPIGEALGLEGNVRNLLGTPIDKQVPTVGAFVNMVLREQLLTEANTDWLLDYIMGVIKVPFWIPKSWVRNMIDGLLPERLLQALETLINKQKNG